MALCLAEDFLKQSAIGVVLCVSKQVYAFHTGRWTKAAIEHGLHTSSERLTKRSVSDVIIHAQCQKSHVLGDTQARHLHVRHEGSLNDR